MDAVEAGRLIAFACDVSAVPGASGPSADYAGLTRRYLSDAVFQRLVDDIAEGVGCVVAHAGLHEGLVLRSEPDGPWCWPSKSADLPWNKTFKPGSSFERAARLLVLPALLAYVAPSAADLDDLLSDPAMIPPPVPVRDLEEFIRDFAHHKEAEESDPVGEERPLWWHWLQTASVTPTSERISRATSTYLVYDVLQFLHAAGLMVKTMGSSAKDAVYRPRRRMLYHYRDLLMDDVFAALREFASDRPTPEGAGSTTADDDEQEG